MALGHRRGPLVNPYDAGTDGSALAERARPRSRAVRRALALGAMTAGMGAATVGVASAQDFGGDLSDFGTSDADFGDLSTFDGGGPDAGDLPLSGSSSSSGDVGPGPNSGVDGSRDVPGTGSGGWSTSEVVPPVATVPPVVVPVLEPADVTAADLSGAVTASDVTLPDLVAPSELTAAGAPPDDDGAWPSAGTSRPGSGGDTGPGDAGGPGGGAAFRIDEQVALPVWDPAAPAGVDLSGGFGPPGTGPSIDWAAPLSASAGGGGPDSGPFRAPRTGSTGAGSGDSAGTGTGTTTGTGTGTGAGRVVPPGEVANRWSEARALFPEVAEGGLSLAELAEAYGLPPERVGSAYRAWQEPVPQERPSAGPVAPSAGTVSDEAWARQQFPEVAQHPSGVTLQDIAEYSGLEPDWVEQLHSWWREDALPPRERDQLRTARSLGGDLQYGLVFENGQRGPARAVITAEMVAAAADRRLGSFVDQQLDVPGFYDLPVGNRAAGHLIPRMAGGSGYREENLVALLQNVNVSPVAAFERMAGRKASQGYPVEYTATPVYETAADTGAPVALRLEMRWVEGGEEQSRSAEISNRATDYVDADLVRHGATMDNSLLLRRTSNRFGLPVEEVRARYVQLQQAPEGSALLPPAELDEVPESLPTLVEQLAPEFTRRYDYQLEGRIGNRGPETFADLGQRVGQPERAVKRAYKEFVALLDPSADSRAEFADTVRTVLWEHFDSNPDEVPNLTGLSEDLGVPVSVVRRVRNQYIQENGARTASDARTDLFRQFELRFLDALTEEGGILDVTAFRRETGVTAPTTRSWLRKLASTYGTEPPPLRPSTPARDRVVDALQRILDDRRNGVPFSEIADDLGVSEGTVREVVAEAGPASRPTRRRTLQEDSANILRDAREGLSVRQLVDKYGTSVSTMRRFLNVQGARVDSLREPVADSLPGQAPGDQAPVAAPGEAPAPNGASSGAPADGSGVVITPDLPGPDPLFSPNPQPGPRPDPEPFPGPTQQERWEIEPLGGVDLGAAPGFADRSPDRGPRTDLEVPRTEFPPERPSDRVDSGERVVRRGPDGAERGSVESSPLTGQGGGAPGRTEGPGVDGGRRFELTFSAAEGGGAQLEGVREVGSGAPAPASAVPAPFRPPVAAPATGPTPQQPVAQRPGPVQAVSDRVLEFVTGPAWVARSARLPGGWEAGWPDGTRGTYDAQGERVSGDGPAAVPGWVLETAGPSAGDVLTGLGQLAEVLTLPARAGWEIVGGTLLRSLTGSH